MNIKTLGYAFPHQKGEFCRKRICDFYSLSCFATPFLYYKDGKLLKGNAGDILINTPGEMVYHGPQDNATHGFINDWFQITGEDFTQLIKKFPVPLNIAFNIGKKDFLRKYTLKLIQEVNSDKYGKEELIECIVTEAIIDLYRNYINANTEDSKISNIINIHNEISLNPENDWKLSEMAKMCGYSISRFYELFKLTYNISPVNFVISERIDMSKQLLISGQASVQSISEACGFSTVNYFSKRFKLATGLTPTDYRNKMLK